jgi:hypothetical protein
MTDLMPRFDEPTPLDATRSWTARFESYDQRNDDAYYIVTTHAAGRPTDRFMAQVMVAVEDWTTPEFVDLVRRQLHAVAAAGRPNTDYRGPLAAR